MSIFNFIKKLKNRGSLSNPPKPAPETAKDLYGEGSKEAHKKEEGDIKSVKTTAPGELPGDGEAQPTRFVDDAVEEMGQHKSHISDLPKSEAFSPAKTSPLMSQNSKKVLKELGGLGKGEAVVKEPPTIQEKIEEALPEHSDTHATDGKMTKHFGSESVASTFLSGDEGTKTVKSNPAPVKAYKRDEGFFHDFEKFLNNRDLDENFISEILGKDLLHKMKQFHLQRDEGTPFFFRSEDSERDLFQKLKELKLLEEEWYIRQRNLKELELLSHEKEADIDLKLEDLKNVLKHIKHRERLEKKADKENYFDLEDGQVLRSIGDLREALETMRDDLLEYHVSEEKNDFADWINQVFEEHDLADKMRLSKSRKELLDVLFDF